MTHELNHDDPHLLPVLAAVCDGGGQVPGTPGRRDFDNLVLGCRKEEGDSSAEVAGIEVLFAGHDVEIVGHGARPHDAHRLSLLDFHPGDRAALCPPDRRALHRRTQ